MKNHPRYSHTFPTNRPDGESNPVASVIGQRLPLDPPATLDHPATLENPATLDHPVTHSLYTPVFRRDVLWYGDVRPGLRPTLRPVSVRPSGSPSARFPHFSPTCFDILSWNFAHDFVLMYYRSSLSVITLRQFLKELCLFVNLEYRKYTVLRSFLLRALTYWAEILHMTLF